MFSVGARLRANFSLNKPTPYKPAAGFTLIELMIVVAIIAIIAAITYPSYERSVLKSHRSDVESLLTEDAQILQRCYTQYFGYNGNGHTCPPTLTTSRHGYYALSPTPPAGISTNAYTLTAVAVGNQTKDTTCRTFTLSSTGQKTAYSASGADNSAACWGN